MKHLTRAAMLAIALFNPLTVWAQPQPSMPKWDAGASFGIMWGGGWEPERDRSPYDFYDDPRVAYHLEAGRFWTTHLKSDFAVMLTPTHEGYDARVVVPGLPAGYVYSARDSKLTAFSGAATYQFFENEMMHPYVSAGLQVGAIEDHTYRSAQTATYNRIVYNVPALDTRSTRTEVRPFFAVGAKSYFNEKTFVKSEFLIGAQSSGFSHAVLRIGFGFDF